MNTYYFDFINILIFTTIIYFLVTKLTNHIIYKKDTHQKFTTENFVLPAGGPYLIFFFILFNFNQLSIEYIIIFSMFIIGLLSDIKKFNSPNNRLLSQTLVIIFFVWFFNIEINYTRVDVLDKILDNYFINIVFVSFCILIVINGTNFIDGSNGHVILYYTLISLILIFSNFEINYLIDKDFLIKLVIFFFFLYLLNISDKLYLGDSGSYFLGFIFGVILINIYYENQYISPYFIILLLWYPCFENLFSIIRKISIKRKPTLADTKHLHQLLFFFLTKKFYLKKIYANNLTPIIINSYNLIIFSIAAKQTSETNIQVLLILTNIFIYFIFYIYLFNFRYKK
tara:strand:- start:1505 stop:2527 length:1023 start_codon:yes stop_codon:yes gene_type:complete